MMTPHRHRLSSRDEGAAADAPSGGVMNGSPDEVDSEMPSASALHDGISCSNGYHSPSGSSSTSNPAKRDDWHDLGRFIPSAARGDHSAAIERNSCMLEDLLATVLDYDARVAAAAAVDAPEIPQARAPITASSLSPAIRSQIRAYVTQISYRYHQVGFHSFEHASHVMLSATKIVYMLQEQSPINKTQIDVESLLDQHASKVENKHEDKADGEGNVSEQLRQLQLSQQIPPDLSGTIHDPWLHFAICLSALLHDVDHKGLPNNELLAERDPLAVKYGSEKCMQSYAEWNSVEIGLSLLRGNEEYSDFAGAVSNPERFYKMVTDLVLCTDIASKERRELGIQKWEKACCGGKRRRMQHRSSISTVRTDNTSCSEMSGGLLKLYTPEAARSISEQIMQAADVSHTMQHFSTFAKWNSHLYHEVLAAYQCGRTPQHRDQREKGISEGEAEIRHPKENWYESQIGFFDHYIIPLAERLDASGAFPDEAKFAPLAVMNKEQWIEEGREYTRLMVEQAEAMELLPPMPVIPADEREQEVGGEAFAASTTTLISGNHKRASECDSILDEINSSIVIQEDAPYDDMSVPESVETSSRVSFAGASWVSKDSIARHASRRMSTLSDYDVDSSLNALVPHILVEQLVDSLRAGIEHPPTLVSPQHQDRSLNDRNHLRDSLIPSRPSNLRESIKRYQSAGSIRRHWGALLFVDISGFTNLSQNYPIEDFKTFINKYFTKIIDLVQGFGGEVVKFAGDALYALWATKDGASLDESWNDKGDSSHARNVEKCTACAIAINATCNKYRVSKSYNRRMSERMSEQDITADWGHGRGQGEVLYSLEDKGAEYEERGSVLNVYCGVSEGIMAGVDVVANNRAEFFLVGKPLKDVAKAEDLAGPGELVVSPSVYDLLRKREIESMANELVFTHVERDFHRVSWPSQPSVEEILHYFKEHGGIIRNNRKGPDAQFLIGELVANCHPDPDDADRESLQSDLMQLLETHRHEAARTVAGKFTAELRRVVVLFISIMYEPSLPEDPSEDGAILENFQSIYSIISESVSSRSGQVRQFINDDKGTVFIASFGLRGSVILHPADTAVDAAKDAQQKLLDILDIRCSIGITLGKVFCGETGSFQRYEYSILGPSVNLSARLMAKGSWGQINCDEELKNSTGRRQTFTISGTHKLKGYDDPVPFYMPAQDTTRDKNEEPDDLVMFFMQKRKLLRLVDNIIWKRSITASKIQPQILLIKGDEGKGKDAFVSAILMQPDLSNSSVILKANRCFHDDPFYVFIPIITRILLSFSETRERLVSLKKRKKSSMMLATFLANDAIRTQAFPGGTGMVPKELEPYLSLVNDFVFKGFPLLKSSSAAKRLKDGEKVEKCTEVLSALIATYLELKEKPGILSISEIDSVDSYSNRLLQRLLKSSANLLVIGGVSDVAALDDGAITPGNSSTFLTSILGKELDIEVIDLELLDKKSTFDLFRWVLRRDFSEEDFGRIDNPAVHDKIFDLCRGMPHATTRLAYTFCAQFQKDQQRSEESSIDELLSSFQTFLNETPTDLDEITCFRVDQMKPEEQMVLKIASVAGFDQYSFSQNLLETVLLSLSRSESSAIAEDSDLDMSTRNDDEIPVPLSIGGDDGVPSSVGTGENKYNYMFQGDFFERTLDSLVGHKFLEEVNVEMGDLSSMDSVMYRFRNTREQSAINGLMLNDQKERTHFEVAVYYSSSFNKGSGDSLGENDSSSLSTDITSVPSTNWELFHIIALHYDLADVPIPAMLHYYDSSASLASLGVRDKAHGRLLSAYLMLEKILHNASTLDVKTDESSELRRKIAGQMVRTIGNDELKDSMKMLTKDHLRHAFEGDIFAFKKCLSMLTKFGQSVGTIEKEGYLFGSELYLQTILLVLLVLEDEAFSNLTSSVASFLGQVDISSMKKSEISSDGSSFSSGDSCFDDFFDIDDLTVSFPAFSGLLTFYRDSPIGANQTQETFLANLFVAVTQEANQMIHVLRTKCILSHLYLKHGNIVKALEECEGIKEIYDHDRYSLQLVTTYGMDWSLVCVMTMASTYLFRGQFSAASHNVEFLREQMAKLDEFASSTKAMSKGNLASFYLLLHDFENASEVASGINATKYGYFFKPIGTLQEELANRELSLSQHKTFDSSARDLDLLSVLSDLGVNHNRPMLNQSAETLSDRGIECVHAALCATEVRNLDRQPNRNADVVRKQIQFCQAGLLYLDQTLDQKDANNHERRKNYLLCLHQQAQLLCWHQKLVQLLRDRFGTDEVDDLVGIEGKELDLARKALDESAELSKTHEYPFMLMLAGNSYVKLGLDTSAGEELIRQAFESIDPKERQSAKDILSRIDDDGQGVGAITLNQPPPPPCPRGVPSAA